MHARDSSGRRVSLLNDDHQNDRNLHRISYRAANRIVSQPYPPAFAHSDSSSPNTPQLLRSDSYDSQISGESISPLTPVPLYDYSRAYMAAHGTHMPYEDYSTDAHSYPASARRPSTLSNSRSSSYEDDTATSPSSVRPVSERLGKRYPCRYRDSHGCEKTFTTSGHASRHSKIHTAEKAVPCTHPGCTKKFTRADNMKQHLETHYKDKSRTSSSRPQLSSFDRRYSRSGETVTSGRKAPAAATSATTPAITQSPLPSPGDWDGRGLDPPLIGRSSVSRVPSNALDALAAVACREES